jgi:hypothetical protein
MLSLQIVRNITESPVVGFPGKIFLRSPDSCEAVPGFQPVRDPGYDLYSGHALLFFLICSLKTQSAADSVKDTDFLCCFLAA